MLNGIEVGEYCIVLSGQVGKRSRESKLGWNSTVYPKKYAHGFCFAVLCCGYTLTDFPISIRLTSLALWQSNDCPSASKATLINMDKYFMWIHYERLHNHNKAMHNKAVCIFLGIYCKMLYQHIEHYNWWQIAFNCLYFEGTAVFVIDCYVYLFIWIIRNRFEDITLAHLRGLFVIYSLIMNSNWNFEFKYFTALA